LDRAAAPAANCYTNGDRAEQHQARRGAEDQPSAPAALPCLYEQHVDVGRLRVECNYGRAVHRFLLCVEHGTTMTSTMFEVNLDRADPLPLHDQVAAQIRRAIADGEAGPGDRLPLAKDLAAVLGVNKNTVLRALHVLREEGLLDFRRGRGITVAGTPQRGAVLSQARNLVQFARQQGYGRDEVMKMIKDLPQDA
jgi:GntR family transcriptional regulator